MKPSEGGGPPRRPAPPRPMSAHEALTLLQHHSSTDVIDESVYRVASDTTTTDSGSITSGSSSSSSSSSSNGVPLLRHVSESHIARKTTPSISTSASISPSDEPLLQHCLPVTSIAAFRSPSSSSLQTAPMSTIASSPNLLSPSSASSSSSSSLSLSPTTSSKKPTKTLREISASSLDTDELDGEEERVRHQTHVVLEIVATERSYLADLRIILNGLATPFLSDKVVKLLSREFRTMMGSIDLLILVSEELLARFEAEKTKHPDEAMIGKTLLENVASLGAYQAYCLHVGGVKEEIERLEEKNYSVVEIVDAFLAAPETRGLNIEQFIIKPFQRITKYPLLLKELIKVTNDESPDLPHRKAALAELHSLVAKINQAKSVQDRVLEVMESIGDITGLPQELNEVDFNRSFIKRGQVLKVTVTSFRRSIYGLENVAKELREFILLSDMLIYCKVGRKDLQYRGYILAGSMLIQDGDPSRSPLTFYLSRSDKVTWIIEVKSEQERLEWLQAFAQVSERATMATRRESIAPALRRAASTQPTRGLRLSDGSLNFPAIAKAMFGPEGVEVKSRSHHFKTYKNAFIGSEAVTWLSETLQLTREEAVEVGQELQARGFYRHVGKSQPFADRSLLYSCSKQECLNTSTIWAREGRNPITVSTELLRLIMEIYQDSRSVFERFGTHALSIVAADNRYSIFQHAVCELQQVPLESLGSSERAAFFINVYNTLCLHSHLQNFMEMNGMSFWERISVFRRCSYKIAGKFFTMLQIEHGILRIGKPAEHLPFASIIPKLRSHDERHRFRLDEPLPLVMFALNCGTASSPPIRVYRTETLLQQLIVNAKEYLNNSVRIQGTGKERTIVLPRLVGWYYRDFGDSERVMVKTIASWLPYAKQVEIDQILATDKLKIKYDEYDWAYQYPFVENQ